MITGKKCLQNYALQVITDLRQRKGLSPEVPKPRKIHGAVAVMRLDVPFDLDFSLCCGQVFRWKKIGEWWYGVVGEKVFKIRQCGAELGV